MTIKLSNIPDSWQKTGGAGIKIGVCDSGLDWTLTEFRPALQLYRHFGEYVPHSDIHGNHICGLIFGSSKRPGLMRGLSPLLNAFVAGIDLRTSSSLENLYDGLCWLKGEEINVLNLSLAYDDEHVGIYELLKGLSDRGVWIFSSFCGSRIFPWSYPFVKSVGYTIESDVDICASRKSISSGVGFQNSQMSGSSVSCALVSGAACLYQSYNKGGSFDDFCKAIDGDKLFIPSVEKRDSSGGYYILGL